VKKSKKKATGTIFQIYLDFRVLGIVTFSQVWYFITMSLKVAHFNQKPNSPSLKTPTAFLSTTGNRRLYTSFN